MGQANRGRDLMVFDWDKAAQLIRDRKPEVASAGLAGDWDWTGGQIYADGKPDSESYTFLHSTWATPELDMDGDVVECWRYEKDSPGWNAGTKWPQSAIAILNGTDAK